MISSRCNRIGSLRELGEESASATKAIRISLAKATKAQVFLTIPGGPDYIQCRPTPLLTHQVLFCMQTQMSYFSHAWALS